MATKLSILRTNTENLACLFGLRNWIHVAAIPPSSNESLLQPISPSPSFSLPESDRESEKDNGVELMAVPKRKTTPHKRGIRNGPKALKPVPVIVRCRSCGRVKLPHYYCCSGHRGDTGGREV